MDLNSIRRHIIHRRIVGAWPVTFAQKRARKFLAGFCRAREEARRK